MGASTVRARVAQLASTDSATVRAAAGWIQAQQHSTVLVRRLVVAEAPQMVAALNHQLSTRNEDAVMVVCNALMAITLPAWIDTGSRQAVTTAGGIPPLVAALRDYGRNVIIAAQRTWTRETVGATCWC